jgi:hypothetical protein
MNKLGRERRKNDLNKKKRKLGGYKDGKGGRWS